MNEQRMGKRKIGSISKRYLQRLTAADSAKVFEEFSRDLDTELPPNDEEMKKRIKLGNNLRLTKAGRSVIPDSDSVVTEFSIHPQDDFYIVQAHGSDEIQIPIKQEDLIEPENITARTTSPILLQDKDFVFPDNVTDVISGVGNVECIEIPDELEEIDESQTQPILAAIRELSHVVSQQKNVLNKILKRMENIENQVKIVYYEPEICHLPPFPLKSAEEVDQLEKLLESDDIYSEMVAFVSQVGGTDLKSMVRRVLRRLLTDKLAVLYSWKGQQQNLAFSEKITLISALKAGIQQNFACSEIEIEVPLIEWLRYAKKRCEREIRMRQKRAAPKKRSLIAKRYLPKLPTARATDVLQGLSRDLYTELTPNEEEMKRKELRLSKTARSLQFEHKSSITPDSSAAITNDKELPICPQDEHHVVQTLIPDEIQIPIKQEDLIKPEIITARATSPILLQDKDFVLTGDVTDVISDVRYECLGVSDEQNENINYFKDEQSDINEESRSPTQYILTIIQKISDAAFQQKTMMDNILKRLEIIENQTIMFFSELPEDRHMPAFPLKTTEEVDQLEKLLQIDDFYLEMVTFVSKIKTVGIDLKSIVSQVLHKIFTDELAMSYSWKGVQQKQALNENIAILGALTAGIQQKIKCSECDVEKLSKDWLRNAKKRYFRRMVGGKNMIK